MSDVSSVREVLVLLLDLLDGEGVPYAVMGGLAVPIWGIPRATFDVDVTVAVDEPTLARFLDIAIERGFEVAEPFREGFRDVLAGMNKVAMAHGAGRPGRVEVDVFVVSTPYQAAAFERRERVRIEDREMWVLSAADVILHKLVAGRHKDRADVQSILAVQGVPDADYLRRWAEYLGIAESLERAIIEAGC